MKCYIPVEHSEADGSLGNIFMFYNVKCSLINLNAIYLF